MKAETKKLVEVRNLKKYFPGTEVSIFQTGNDVKAVDGVSFDIYEQETLGLVGETGCGKTTVGRTMLHLYQPTSGSIIFDGVDLNDLGERELRFARSKMQMIFQDPYASLNPRLTVFDTLSEAIRTRHDYKGRELANAVGS